jgi:hypothetical protein
VSRNHSQSAALGWVDGQPPAGEESLWARFDYLKLRETLEAIVSAMETTAQTDGPQSEPESDATLRLVVSNDRPETAGDPSPEEPPQQVTSD